MARLSDADQTYLLDHEAQWEGVKSTDDDAKGDALDACADFNRRSAEARQH